jgi:hypothetical protein
MTSGWSGMGRGVRASMREVYTVGGMRATGGISAVKCYDGGTTTKALSDLMKRVETWPYEAQEELAGIALEMDAAAKGGPINRTAGARVVPLVRYPYKIFYRVTPDAVEILQLCKKSPRLCGSVVAFI